MELAAEQDLEASLRRHVQQMGGPLLAFHNLRILQHARHIHPGPLRSVFEIGSFQNTGLAALLLSRGVEHVGMCNVGEITAELPPGYLSILQFISNLAGYDWSDQRLSAVGPAPEHVSLYPATPYEALVLDRRYDLIFSASVLEHLSDVALDEQLDKMWGDLSDDGWLVHTIDLRDHSAFDDPLRFLRLSEAEYAAQYTLDLGNRRRWGVYVEAIAARGFEIVWTGFGGKAPVHASGHTDMFDTICQPIGAAYPASPDLLPKLDRTGLVEPWRSMPDDDLATVALRVIARKP